MQNDGSQSDVAECVFRSVRGAGGYQMFGTTPMPIFDRTQSQTYLRELMVLCRSGDLVKFQPVRRESYDAHLAAVERTTFEPVIRPVRFGLHAFEQDMDGYNASLIAARST